MSDKVSADRGGVSVGGDVSGDIQVMNFQIDGGEIPPAILELLRQKKGMHIPYTRNANFTGRDMLLAALQATLRSTQAHIMVLTGLGGIGKTQLALEYSYCHQNDYDIVWWLHSEQPSTLLDDYALMATRLKLPGWDTGDLNLMAMAARSFLEAHSRWLLVFDNAKDPRGLKPYLPHGGGGHVILTSRNLSWGNLARALEVPKFERPESIEFLLNRTLQQGREAADLLAEALGDLPLALEQAGAYMETTGKPLGEYLMAFRERKLKVLAKGRPSDYPDTVATTWDISFQAVHEDYPAASELLRLFSHLAPDEIPLRYLVKGSEMLPHSVAHVLRDEDERDEALAALRRYSLISRSGDKVSVHRLVQAVTRDDLALQEQKDWAGTAVKLLNNVFPEDHLDNVQSWEECSILLPHALAAAGYAEQLEVVQVASGRLLNESGVYLRTRGEFVEARSALERALRITEKAFSPDNPNVAPIATNLGLVLQAMGDLPEAKICCERALKIDENSYGLDHPNVASDVNNLGMVLQSMDDFQEARKCYERALSIVEKVFGKDHPKVAPIANNLGSVLQDLGDFEGARKLLERALKIDEKAFSPDNPNVASIANNLGSVLQALDDFEGARKLFKRALEIDENAYGLDHPNVSRDVNNLGLVLQALGDLQGARECYERALKICRDKLGPDHPNTRTVANNLDSLRQG